MSFLPEKVARRIRTEIVNGTYSKGSRLEPIRQLCTKFGVSHRTISSALDALETDGLIIKLPRRGIEISDKFGSISSNNLSTKSKIIFIRLTLDENSYALTQGLRRASLGYKEEPLIVDAQASHSQFLNAFRYPPKGIKGIVLQVHDHPDFRKAIMEDYKSGLKIVCVGRVLAGFDFSSVTSDNFAGGYKATEHLILAHNRAVYHITYKDSPSSARDRRQGWAQAMRSHGFNECQDNLLVLPCSEYEVLLEENEAGRSRCYQAIVALFSRRQEKRFCIFAVNDAVAQLVYRAVAELGLQVGKDVFVVGFDNLPLCNRLDPPLSSVHQSVEQLGYEAGKLLYEEIAGNVTPPIHQVIPVHLEVRASSIG